MLTSTNSQQQQQQQQQHLPYEEDTEKVFM